MQPPEIPKEVSHFCAHHYELIRDWVEFSEEAKAEMKERFPHLKLPWQCPVMPIEVFYEDSKNN